MVCHAPLTNIRQPMVLLTSWIGLCFVGAWDSCDRQSYSGLLSSCCNLLLFGYGCGHHCGGPLSFCWLSSVAPKSRRPNVTTGNKHMWAAGLINTTERHPCAHLHWRHNSVIVAKEVLPWCPVNSTKQERSPFITMTRLCFQWKWAQALTFQLILLLPDGAGFSLPPTFSPASVSPAPPWYIAQQASQQPCSPTTRTVLQTLLSPVWFDSAKPEEASCVGFLDLTWQTMVVQRASTFSTKWALVVAPSEEEGGSLIFVLFLLIVVFVVFVPSSSYHVNLYSSVKIFEKINDVSLIIF